MTPDILAEYIAKAKAEVAKRYKPLVDAYNGVYPILSQKEKPKYKPDNRLVVSPYRRVRPLGPVSFFCPYRPNPGIFGYMQPNLGFFC